MRPREVLLLLNTVIRALYQSDEQSVHSMEARRAVQLFPYLQNEVPGGQAAAEACYDDSEASSTSNDSSISEIDESTNLNQSECRLLPFLLACTEAQQRLCLQIITDPAFCPEHIRWRSDRDIKSYLAEHDTQVCLYSRSVTAVLFCWCCIAAWQGFKSSANEVLWDARRSGAECSSTLMKNTALRRKYTCMFATTCTLCLQRC